MLVTDEICFKEIPIPSPELILNEVKKISGLEGLSLSDEKDEITHPDFLDRRYFYFKEDNCVILERGWVDKWYLYDATICALVNLGGTYDGEIPILGNKKWAEVKDLYPVVKNFRSKKR